MSETDKATLEVIKQDIIALRNMADEMEAKLVKLEQKKASPAPTTRRRLKAERIQGIAEFYMRRKIKKTA